MVEGDLVQRLQDQRVLQRRLLGIAKCGWFGSHFLKKGRVIQAFEASRRTLSPRVTRPLLPREGTPPARA